MKIFAFKLPTWLDDEFHWKREIASNMGLKWGVFYCFE